MVYNIINTDNNLYIIIIYTYVILIYVRYNNRHAYMLVVNK